MKRLLLLLVVLFFAVPSAVEFYTDLLWFREVGYEQVFLRSLTARATIGAVVGLVALVFLAANLALALRGLAAREFMIATAQGPRVVRMNPRQVSPAAFAAALLAAVFIGVYAASQWEIFLYYLHATPFGSADPVLGRDVGFYIFTLPLLDVVHNLLLALVLLATGGVLLAQLFGGNISFDPVRGLYVARSARWHLSLLAAAFFLLLAYGAWLRIPQMLTTPAGVVFGASYVDVHARMPALRVLMAVAVAGAGLAIWQLVSARLWAIGAAAILYVIVAAGGSAYAQVIQRFVVGPNEQVRETPYIVHNIQATRRAFALDKVEERPLHGDARLTRADLERNSATIANVPLWNDQPLLDTFGQIQEIRTYYDFESVDNDRYTINGQYRQIMLSARELDSRSLPSRTWINERLTFTHGYGLTLGPVNEVTPEGLPVLFIRDLPPVSTVDLTVKQPAIYFGERASDHVFVRTKTEEFDYPRGDDNVFTTYQGNGGVPLSNVLRRLLFAIRFRSTDTFFSPNLTNDSRVMMYRRIAERVQRIAPFFTYDPDPYIAISGDRLVWVQDAYTTSDRYPYSSPARPGLNYIRNSIKVTIDAYHGTTVFHLLDEADPIAATIGKVFPGLLTPLNTMPEDLRGRLRYPHGIFSLQASTFATFHMTNPAVFYNREDQWEIPTFDVNGQSRAMEPYYTIMKLPGETGPEYIQMLPFTPRQKDNLAAWMVARSDGGNYGHLRVFQFPKQTVVFGPKQIAARISQDQLIAPQITLWNQQGSQVIQGTLLVIPIEESLLYIRPLYLRAAGGRIPELKRVIVAYQNQIVMEERLDQALDRLFAAGTPSPAVPPPVEAAPPEPQEEGAPETATLARQAREHYDRAMRAQREGNWALYGEEIKKLGEVLQRMQKN